MDEPRRGAPKSTERKAKLGTPPVRRVEPSRPKSTGTGFRRAFLDGWNAPAPKSPTKLQKLKFEGMTLVGANLTWQRADHDIRGAAATVESAASARSRITATRVVGGFALFGPLGAIIGGLAKKDTSKVFLIVELADGSVLTEDVRAKHEGDARRFAAAINEAGRA